MGNCCRAFAFALGVLAVSCNSNLFAPPESSIEGFNLYTTDFSAQNDGGMKAALLEVINGSKATLHCAFSALTLSDVSSAIIARSQAGVKVKVVFDADVRDSDTGSLALQASGAFVVVSVPGETTQGQLLYGNSGTGVMRHNFCLSDERYVWLSTAAPDDAQMRLTPNIAIKVGSPQFGLARDFLRESSMFSQLLFGGGKAKTDYTTKFAALDQVIAAYWGPQESPMDVLGTELSEATRTVDFYSTAFQATNTSSTKSYLDVPTVLKALETAKGVTIRKYFSSQALFDSASKAYTLTNPSQYVNSNVRVGANIFVVDRNLSSARTYIYTGALRSQGNSSDDSVLLELRGPRVAQLLGAYLDRIGGMAVPVSNTGDAAAPGHVVISEIIWMGSYSNAQIGDGADEFIEFYNNTTSAINMSGWQFACTTNGINNNSAITLPPGALIAPGGYFVVAAKNTGAFAGSANHFDSKVGITNASVECGLGNGKTVATVYSIANFGVLIDTIGNNTNGFDTAGWNRGVNNGSPNFIRKSMERVNTAAPGNVNTNWRTNGYTFGVNTLVSANFRSNTFASPGASGTFTETALPGQVVINEILWMGSYDNGGTGQTDDEFIELYNNTASSIDISNWTISGTGISTVTIPTGQTIAANGYYVIARNTSLAVSSANYSTTTAMSITNSAFQLELRTSLNTLIDTANAGGAPLAGVNDATNLYRRSMERTTTGTDGTLAASWQSSLAAGTGVAAGYRARTIATPGQVNSLIPASPLVGDLVVNEILWMGSCDNAATGQTDDEFIELRNRTGTAIDISFWSVSGTGVSTITLPPAQTIPANGYYVIARNTAMAVSSANFTTTSPLSVSNTAFQIQLRTSTNTLIDTANNGGLPLSGVNDATNQYRRSMERTTTGTDGTLAASWQSAFTAGSGIAAGYNSRTLATPGQVNSTIPADPAVGDVVVNELMWMGSYDNASNTQPDDEFIELWNKTASAINISFWQVNGTGINAVTLPPGQTIPANGYYVIARNNFSAFPTANYYKGSTLGLSSTTLQVELRTSRNTVIDTANNGGAPHAGLNDTTNQIRRSMERRPTATDGTLAASWLNSGVVGTNVAAGFSTRTIATPGQANSFYPQTVTVVSSTSITVQYNLLPTAGTGAAGAENTANYTFTGGLTVSAASLAGNVVTLTTSAQTPGASYTLTISNVTASGNSATLSANTANVTGFVSSASVLITELNANVTSSCDLVELTVTAAGNMNGIKVLNGGELTDTAIVTFSSFEVAAGDIIIVHLNNGATCNPASAGNETTATNEFPIATHTRNYDTSWDWYSATAGLTGTDAVVSLTNSAGTALQDAFAYSNVDGTTLSAGAKTDMCAIFNGTDWTNLASCGTQSNATIENNAASDSDNLSTGVTTASASFQRFYNTTTSAYCDGNKPADWVIYTAAAPRSSFGSLNNIVGPAVAACP